jgi:hypothetical protein
MTPFERANADSAEFYIRTVDCNGFGRDKESPVLRTANIVEFAGPTPFSRFFDCHPKLQFLLILADYSLPRAADVLRCQGASKQYDDSADPR